MEEHWSWSDNSTWDFTNWENGRGVNYDRLFLKSSGEWYDYPSFYNLHFLCKWISGAITDKGLARIKLKQEQLTFFPFILTLKSPAINQRMSNSSAEKRTISGFTLNWFVEDSDDTQLIEKLPPRADDCKPVVQAKYRETLLGDMVQLARHLT